jgi:transposase
MGKKSVSMETKWQAIGMHKLNLSNREIARRLNISEKCVRTTLKNFKESGSVADKPRSGAPKKLSERDENALYQISRQDPSTRIAAEFNPKLVAAKVTRRTMSILLQKKSEDLNSSRAYKKPSVDAI